MVIKKVCILNPLSDCFIPDGKHVNAALNDRRFILRPIEHAAFHTKPLCVPGEKIAPNVKTNKLMHAKRKRGFNPNKDGLFEGSFFWGVNLNPPFIFQGEII